MSTDEVSQRGGLDRAFSSISRKLEAHSALHGPLDLGGQCPIGKSTELQEIEPQGNAFREDLERVAETLILKSET